MDDVFSIMILVIFFALVIMAYFPRNWKCAFGRHDPAFSYQLGKTIYICCRRCGRTISTPR